MSELDEALDVLKQLGRKHGKVLSLSLVFKTFLQKRICDSRGSIADCLRNLQDENKIKPINFGIDIELLGDIESGAIAHVQSSLDGFKKRI